MSASHRSEPRANGTTPGRTLQLSGGLLLFGFLVNAIQRMLLHPSGAEDDHEAIFKEYAESDVWVATHLAEFVLVLVVFAGLLVLCRALYRETPYLALLSAGALVPTAAVWAVLQGVDGVALKEVVDAWAGSSGAEAASRFADAESVRWIEWGLQGYFRVLLGLALLLLGASVVANRHVPSWLGAFLVVAALLSVALGFSVADAGLESRFQDAAAIGFQLAVVALTVGLLVVGRKAGELGSPAATT